MKTPKNKPTYNGIAFDSGEELEFYHWCEEAKAHHYISYFDYHPKPFVLSEKVTIQREKQLRTKTKIVDEFVFHSHEYTPDFVLNTSEIFEDLSHGLKIKTGPFYYIDIKGGFSIYNNEREFAINQKWVYQKYYVYINKVIPKLFFAKTWVPRMVCYNKRTGARKDKFAGCKLVEQMPEYD